MSTQNKQNNPDRYTIFYHARCPDGMCAAYLTWEGIKAMNAKADIWLIPVNPGTMGKRAERDDAKGAHVYFVDVCPSKADLAWAKTVAASITLLDHHTSSVTAAESCGYSIDQSCCGAALAWKHFHGDEPLPELVRYLDDMDRYVNELPYTFSVRQVIRKEFSQPEDTRWMRTWFQDAMDEIIAIGTHLQAAQDAMVASIAKRAKVGTVGQTMVVAVHGYSHGYSSDVANALAVKHQAFALVYRRTVKGWSYAVRSPRGSDLDCTELAGRFGGGGHKHAAGFLDRNFVIDFGSVA